MSADNIDSLLGEILKYDYGSPQAHRRVALDLQAYPTDSIARIVDGLEQEAIHLRLSDQAQRSEALSRLIVQIGQRHNNPNWSALGLMLGGDYRHLVIAKYSVAWVMLQEAARLFRQEGHNDFGWARTRIGAVRCAILLGKLDEIHEDIAEAERIFQASQHPQALDKLAVLYQNVSYGYSHQSRFDESIQMLRQIISLCHEYPGRIDPLRRPDAEHNLGFAYGCMGYARRSIYYFARAYVLYRKQGQADLFQRQIRSLLNIAESERLCGLYPDALRRLDHALSELEHRMDTATAFGEWVHVTSVKIGCLLEVRHYEEAYRMTRDLLERTAHMNRSQEIGHVLVYFARVQANLGQLDAALSSINQAINIFATLKQEFNLMVATLWSARLNLYLDPAAALHDAEVLVNYFDQIGSPLRAAEARLVIAEVLLQSGNSLFLKQAQEQVTRAFEAANTCLNATLIHQSLLLQGRIARLQGDPVRSEQHYREANRQVDSLQRGLTITLRPYFLADKGEATRELIRLRLDQQDISSAFRILQDAKQRVFDEYLAEAALVRQHPADNGNTRAYELRQLREDYHALTEQLQRTIEAQTAVPAHQHTLERNIHLTAQRILEMARQQRMEHPGPSTLTTFDETRSHLSSDDVLIAYYDDGDYVQAFVLGTDHLSHHVLAASSTIRQLSSQLYHAILLGIKSLRRVAHNTQVQGDYDILSLPELNHPNRKRDFDTYAEQLYDMLLAPVHSHWSGRRVFIAPYGALHQLPFHLLRDCQRQQYLVELSETVILPTAILSPATLPQQQDNATILYDDFGGTLRYARRDAERLHQLLGGRLIDAAATPADSALRSHAGAILHIVAHGYFDQRYPALSYLQFRDRQIMAVDLPEYALDGALVILTSCNTGRLWQQGQAAAAGDDQVGLGRMFLYAGARALVTSQWEIGDGLTLSLLEAFYQRLLVGDTASSALRRAQVDMLNQLPNLHPVFWGAYQLISAHTSVSAHQ